MSKRIEFLPLDITSLQTKLFHLLGEFQGSNTPATRNEIVAIADNLLKRKHITKAEYRKINDYISHQGTMYHCNQYSKTFASRRNVRRHQENSCNQTGDGLYLFKSGQGLKKVAEKVDDMPVDDQDDEMVDPVTDPEEVLANKIKDTTEYLIRHDKDEIKKLLKKFQDSDENYEDDVVRLCELVETWIEKQVATEVEIPTTDIKRILGELQRSSSIPRSQLFRIEMLLKDIFENRYRVTDIVLSGLNVLDKDVSWTLKNLVRE